MKAKIVNLSGTGREEGVYGLVAENGEILFTHFCSSIGWAYGDLYDDRPDRQKMLKERFGTFEIER